MKFNSYTVIEVHTPKQQMTHSWQLQEAQKLRAAKAERLSASVDAGDAFDQVESIRNPYSVHISYDMTQI